MAENVMLSCRFQDAFAWACDIHAQQRRHNSHAPYISHLMQTAALVLEDGLDEDAAIAALLHDAIEDQRVSTEEIARRFGPRVAGIVADCTDSFSMRDAATWLTRKTNHVDRMASMSEDSLRVIAADKVASLQSLIDDLTVLGWGLFDDSARSAQDLLWNYEQVLAILQARRITGAPVQRLAYLTWMFQNQLQAS